MSLSIADKMAILDLCARYSYAYDYDDVEAYAELFTKDGVVEFIGSGAQHQGREALKAFANSWPAREHHFRHHLSNHVIEGDGDTAAHKCYFVCTWSQEDKVVVWGTGDCKDRLAKTDGEWRFTYRGITTER